MAKRYIGDAVIRIAYRDACEANGYRDDYHGTVSADGRVWKFDGLRSPACGWSFASDSSEAYDQMAAHAVAFGSYYTTHNRGEDLPDWAPDAETADAISEATCWAQDDGGDWEVRRSPKSGSRVYVAA